ncbi:MAG: lysophospholipid acyltransferase family protein [Acidimicrobiia bacterium]
MPRDASSHRLPPRSRQLTRRGDALWSISFPTLRGLGRLAYSLSIEMPHGLPAGPFVLAANHFSHFDPVVVGAAIGRPIRFLAVDELFGVSPLLDWLLHTYGVIPVSRSRLPLGTLRTALDRLRAGEVVGVFPEGTRVRQWGDLPMKRGAAWLAIRAGVPLVPIAISGTDRAFGVDNRLRPGRITVVVGEPLDMAGHDATTLTSSWGTWVSEALGQ